MVLSISDIPTLLVIAGILFIFIAIVRNIGYIGTSIDENTAKILGIVGIIFIVLGVVTADTGIFLPSEVKPVPTPTPSSTATPTATLSSTATPTTTPSSTATPTATLSSTATPTATLTPTPTITATTASPPQPVGRWQKIDDFPLQVNTIVSDPTNLQVLYAGSKGGVYKSEDTGITWQLITQETLGDEAMALALTCDVLPILYADVHGEIFASTDGAKSWNYMGDTKFRSGFWHHLIVAPSDQNVLFNIAIPGGVALSSDGGSNWQSVYKGLPNEENSAFALSLVIDPIDKNVVYMGTGEWVYGGSGYGVYKSKDGGETWSSANLGIENYRIIALAIDPSEPQILYASEGGGKLFKSTDGGQNWKDITDKLPIQDNSNPSIKEIVVDPAASKTLYLLREQFGVLVSNDGGVNWHIIGKPPVESKYNAFTMAINFDQHPVLILGVEGDGGWRYITEG